MSARTKEAKQLEKNKSCRKVIKHHCCFGEQIRDIKASGEIAPTGCHLARYQARGQYKAYWYYKLQAKQAIFPETSQGNFLVISI